MLTGERVVFNGRPSSAAQDGSFHPLCTLQLFVPLLLVELGVLLEKSGLVFPKLTNITIHMNSIHSRNIWQNTDTK